MSPVVAPGNDGKRRCALRTLNACRTDIIRDHGLSLQPVFRVLEGVPMLTA